MSGKQNIYSTADGETYTNPCFPNLIFKKVNGKDVVVGVKSESINRETNTTTKINFKTKNT